MKKKIFFLIIIVLVLSSCKRTEPQKDIQILFIGDAPIYKQEVMLYAYKIRTEFEQMLGEDVWEYEDFTGGKTAKEIAKQALLENILRTKVLIKKAEDLKISLDEEEKEKIRKKAEGYFEEEIDKEFIEENKIDIDLIIRVFQEFELSNKMENKIKSDYQPLAKEITEKKKQVEDKELDDQDIIELLREERFNKLYKEWERDTSLSLIEEEFKKIKIER